MIQPWWSRAIGTRWGFAYHTCVLWAARGMMGPIEVLRQWDTEVPKSVDVVVIYRELILADVNESGIARRIVELTPKAEKKHVLRHFMTPPEVFGTTASRQTIADQVSPLLLAAKMPKPELADEDALGGWRLLHNMLRRGRQLAESSELEKDQIDEGPCLFVSKDCVKLREAIPMFIRNAKDSELIAMEKRDASSFDDTSQACGEALRILCKSMVSAKVDAPAAVRRRELWDSMIDPTDKAMAVREFDAREKSKQHITRGKRWR